MPSGIVQCCVTSPPYFALRSYLPKDHPDKAKEIGSEPTPEAFIQTMVTVFHEVRRVLRDDGVCFVNLGDSYACTPAGCGAEGVSRSSALHGIMSDTYRETLIAGHGTKRDTSKAAPVGNLLNIPHRVAEALRADGWVWRQTIIFAKRSPMPESVNGWRWMRCSKRTWPDAIVAADAELRRDRQQGRDFGQPTITPCPGCPKCEPHGGYVLRRGAGRCTTAHEYILVLTKSNRYFWDGEASKEKNTEAGRKRLEDRKPVRLGGDSYPTEGLRSGVVMNAAVGRNPRSVWLLSSEPTSERHFATFQSELVRRCLVAGCSAGGCCPTCGAPWAPVVESERVATRPGVGSKVYTEPPVHPESPVRDHAGDICGNRDPQRHCTQTRVSAYRPTCDCPPGEPGAQLVLDPFCGLATVGQTAIYLGHKFVGIDLNSKYLDVAIKRITKTPRWRLRQLVAKKVKLKSMVSEQQGILF